MTVDAVLILLVLSNLALPGMGRLGACIRLVAVQGVLMGALTLATGHTVHAYAMAAGGIVLKGVVFPWLLNRALREAEVNREVEPFVGYTLSILIGLAALGASLWLGGRLDLPASTFHASVAFFTAICGLFLIVSRRKALTQVLGYLVMENGIYALGLVLARDEPLWVALGVLLDVFVAVFLMGIMIFHISREFDHIDVDRLTTLKDWTRHWRKADL